MVVVVAIQRPLAYANVVRLKESPGVVVVTDMDSSVVVSGNVVSYVMVSHVMVSCVMVPSVMVPSAARHRTMIYKTIATRYTYALLRQMTQLNFRCLACVISLNFPPIVSQLLKLRLQTGSVFPMLKQPVSFVQNAHNYTN